MDVTIGSLAATQLQGGGSRENQADVVGPSFDLFLNFNETVGPIQSMEQHTDQHHHDRDNHRQSEPSSATSRRDDSEDGAEGYSYRTRRDERSTKKVDVSRSEDDLSLLADKTLERVDVDNSSSEETPNDDVAQSVDAQRSSPDDAHDDEDLSGAQVRTGESGKAKSFDDENSDIKKASKFQFEPAVEDELIASDTEGDEIKAQSIVRDAESVEVVEASVVAQSNEEDELFTDEDGLGLGSDDESIDQQEFLSSQEDRSDLDSEGQNVEQSDGLDDGFDLDSFNPEDDSRFLDENSSQDTDVADSSPDDIDDGGFDLMSGPEASESEGEWARLLQGSSLAEKVSQSGRSNQADTVRFGATATRVGGLDGGGARAASGTAVIQEPAKANAPTPTKLAQPPTPGRLPEGVDELSIFRQISDGMRLRNGRTQRADIRLSPEELGTVRIQMEMKNGSMRVLMNTENAAVGDLVSNGLDQLRRDMLAQGVYIEHLEVRSELAGQDGQHDQTADEDDEAMARDEQGKQPVQRRRKHRGRLSVQA
jgi:hypothetical protein